MARGGATRTSATAVTPLQPAIAIANTNLLRGTRTDVALPDVEPRGVSAAPSGSAHNSDDDIAGSGQYQAVDLVSTTVARWRRVAASPGSTVQAVVVATVVVGAVAAPVIEVILIVAEVVRVSTAKGLGPNSNVTEVSAVVRLVTTVYGVVGGVFTVCRIAATISTKSRVVDVEDEVALIGSPAVDDEPVYRVWLELHGDATTAIWLRAAVVIVCDVGRGPTGGTLANVEKGVEGTGDGEGRADAHVISGGIDLEYPVRGAAAILVTGGIFKGIGRAVGRTVVGTVGPVWSSRVAGIIQSHRTGAGITVAAPVTVGTWNCVTAVLARAADLAQSGIAAGRVRLTRGTAGITQTVVGTAVHVGRCQAATAPVAVSHCGKGGIVAGLTGTDGAGIPVTTSSGANGA